MDRKRATTEPWKIHPGFAKSSPHLLLKKVMLKQMRFFSLSTSASSGKLSQNISKVVKINFSSCGRHFIYTTMYHIADIKAFLRRTHVGYTWLSSTKSVYRGGDTSVHLLTNWHSSTIYWFPRLGGVKSRMFFENLPIFPSLFQEIHHHFKAVATINSNRPIGEHMQLTWLL